MKNKIQILIFSLVAIFGFVGVTNASYTLTGDDLKQFNSLKATISQSSDYGLWSYYLQLSEWSNILKDDERLYEISNKLRAYSFGLFDSRKKLAKQQSL
jgi:hypothetical protein